MKRWVARERDRSLICEMDARGVPGAQNDHCLICETDNAVRRIWHFPADWHRLEDAMLIALFDQPFAWHQATRAALPDSNPAR